MGCGSYFQKVDEILGVVDRRGEVLVDVHEGVVAGAEGGDRVVGVGEWEMVDAVCNFITLVSRRKR